MGSSSSNIFLMLLLFTKICVGKKCLKNDDIGWREGNIYECTDPQYPACCEIYRKFTCCEEPSVKNLKEQLQLWGTLSVIAALLFIVYLYYNNDSQPCCPCSCDMAHVCATFFRHLRNTCSRRKDSFVVQSDKNGTKGLCHSVPGNLPYPSNVYEKIINT